MSLLLPRARRRPAYRCRVCAKPMLALKTLYPSFECAGCSAHLMMTPSGVTLWASHKEWEAARK